MSKLDEYDKIAQTDNFCPVQEVLEIVSGKWAFLILYNLTKGTKRFSELERAIAGINTRMLSKELKELEKNNLVTRKAYATVPPTVEYSLTAQGQELQPIFEQLHKYGMKYLGRVEGRR